MKKIFSFDSQVLNLVDLCGAKFRYSLIDNLQLTENTQPYFETGDLVHTMLKCYYRTIMAKYQGKWKESFTHEQLVKNCIAVGYHHAQTYTIDGEEIGLTIKSFHQYVEWTKNNGWIPLAVEEVAAKTLYEDDEYHFIYTGTIDLVLSMPQLDPPILPVDHKSSKQNRFMTGLSNQFYGYCWLLGTRRLFVNKFGLQITVPPEKKFVPAILNYTDDLIEEWKEDTIDTMKKAVKMMESSHFKRNMTSCDKYGGCIYQNICNTDRGAREWKIETKYKVGKKWNPLSLILSSTDNQTKV